MKYFISSNFDAWVIKMNAYCCKYGKEYTEIPSIISLFSEYPKMFCTMHPYDPKMLSSGALTVKTLSYVAVSFSLKVCDSEYGNSLTKGTVSFVQRTVVAGDPADVQLRENSVVGPNAWKETIMGRSRRVIEL